MTQAENTIGGWIFSSNLRPCLTLVAIAVDSFLEESDWKYVRQGLQKTSDIDSKWFSHVLTGDNSYFEFDCALDDGDTSTGKVHLRFYGIKDPFKVKELKAVMNVCCSFRLLPLDGND